MVSLIIPTYEERENIELLLDRLAAVRSRLEEPLEVLVVDSHSKDGTATLAQGLLRDNQLGRVVEPPPQCDLAQAVLIGIQQATGDLIGVMDADLSHPPELLPTLVRAIRKEGAQVAVASRYVQGGGFSGWPWHRKVLSRLGNVAVRPLTPVADATSGYFVCQAPLMRLVGQPVSGFKVLLELLVRGRASRIKEIPYVFTDRQRGISKLRVRILWAYAKQLARLYWHRWRHAGTQAGPGSPSVCVPPPAGFAEREQQSCCLAVGEPAGGGISAVILAKNEEARILRCLNSLDWVDEVIVVDDESADQTRELCTRFGAQVVVRRSNGDFDAQRNAGIDAAHGQWIFQLDADEVIPPSLRDEIRSTLQQEGPVVAYRIHRLNHFLGRPMRFGGWGWRGVKLFKRSSARYVGHSVHETLSVDGPIADLVHPVHHYPFQDLAQFVERQNFYSDVEAGLLRQAHPVLTPRALRSQLFVRPLKLFWKSYVRKQGWRDGMHGLVFAALFGWVHFLKWAKYWAESQRSIVQSPQVKTSELPAPSSQLPTNGRETLSVVILTKNEEGRIARCLESVRWADEIIVVDGESQDGTPEICRSFGAIVVSHAFDGSFATDRNLGMQHAHGEWVLQIDADDVVTPEFHAAVDALLRTGSPHAALAFRRRSVLLGRRMRYGGWYYTVPNLVRRDRAVYEGLVHERPRIRGTVGELAADVEHHPCEELSSFVARHNRYTTLQAEELLRRLGPQVEGDLKRQLWRKPWKTFWKSYVKKAGWREGLHGLVFAEFYAGIELLKWAKVWERSVPRRT